MKEKLVGQLGSIDVSDIEEKVKKPSNILLIKLSIAPENNHNTVTLEEQNEKYSGQKRGSCPKITQKKKKKKVIRKIWRMDDDPL